MCQIGIDMKMRQTSTEADCPLIRAVKGSSLSMGVLSWAQGAQEFTGQKMEPQVEVSTYKSVPSQSQNCKYQKEFAMLIILSAASWILTACRRYCQHVNFPVQSFSAHLWFLDLQPFIPDPASTKKGKGMLCSSDCLLLNRGFRVCTQDLRAYVRLTSCSWKRILI